MKTCRDLLCDSPPHEADTGLARKRHRAMARAAQPSRHEASVVPSRERYARRGLSPRRDTTDGQRMRARLISASVIARVAAMMNIKWEKPWGSSVQGMPPTFIPNTPVTSVTGNIAVVTIDNR